MDFIDKKEKLADLLEAFIAGSSNDELSAYIQECSNDSEFKSKELFMNIFNELMTSLEELSRKELKQRVLLIRSFMD